MDHRRSAATPSGKLVHESLNALLLRSWSDAEAVVIRQLLAGYGINCHLASQVSFGLFPLTCGSLGEIRILVSPSRLIEAQRLLAEHRREGLHSIRGGRAEAGRSDDNG